MKNKIFTLALLAALSITTTHNVLCMFKKLKKLSIPLTLCGVGAGSLSGYQLWKKQKEQASTKEFKKTFQQYDLQEFRTPTRDEIIQNAYLQERLEFDHAPETSAEIKKATQEALKNCGESNPKNIAIKGLTNQQELQYAGLTSPSGIRISNALASDKDLLTYVAHHEAGHWVTKNYQKVLYPSIEYALHQTKENFYNFNEKLIEVEEEADQIAVDTLYKIGKPEVVQEILSRCLTKKYQTVEKNKTTPLGPLACLNIVKALGKNGTLDSSLKEIYKK